MEPSAQHSEYEAPLLVALGSVAELTEGCHHDHGKHLGNPDHFKNLLSLCSA